MTKIVYLIIIPEWRHHLWHSLIQNKASHRFVFSVDEEMCGAPKAFYPFAGYVIDSRFNTRPNDLITVYLPSPSHSSRLFFPPRQILPRHDGNFIKNRPKPHLNAQWFLEWGRELPPKLLSDVVTGITTGFPTQYRGGGDFVRDYASPMGEEEEIKATEKASDSVTKGWAAGPFDFPPFPTSFCNKQPIITKSFTIPKHKWNNDGALRLIFHKSFPLGHSINSLTPRHDAASYFPKGWFKYFNIARLLSIIAKAGEGCLLTQFDARDAYKQLLVILKDLNQQVFKAGGKYFIDFCASFGSVYGNDAYSTFAYAHCFCLSRAADCPLLSYYVDNYVNVTPFTGKTTWVRAMIQRLALIRELKRSGLMYHQLEGPTTQITFLGWDIDTKLMTVSITKTRQTFIIEFLYGWREKISFSIADLSSLIE